MRPRIYRMLKDDVASTRSSWRVCAMALALALVALVSSCVEVDMCDSVEHPHKGAVKFDYTWDDTNVHPDTMGVVAYRVVDKAKQQAKVVTSTLLVDGYESLPLPTGAYKFVTYPYMPDAFDYSEINDFVDGRRDTLQQIYISYIQYAAGDGKLRGKPREWNGMTTDELDKWFSGITADGRPNIVWDDYNGYAGLYLQPDIDILYLDTTQVVRVNKDAQQRMSFRPYALTQDIDFYFDIEKKIGDAPFVVDNVWAEVSGVPRRMNLCNGYIDISKTSRIMFPIDMTANDGSKTNNKGESPDTDTNTRLRCHGNINVPGIVNVQQRYGESLDDVRKKLAGPGIMQVIIYGHAGQGDNVKRRRWQGIINLYDVLASAKLIKLTPDGTNAVLGAKHADINISAVIRMDGNSILRDVTSDDAISGWIPTSSISVDL